MHKYPSIETIYVRDHSTNILQFGDIRLPEIECVKEWTLSEKIDGTNIRVIITAQGIDIRGRTDKAQLPPGLEDAILSAIPSHDKLLDFFREYGGRVDEEGWSVTFYGEGYGAGIQKGGSYSDTKSFRVFDLMLGENTWVDDDEMRRVAQNLGMITAPFLGYHSHLPQTEEELTALMPTGSIVAQVDSGREGVPPEGVVAKPRHVLLDKYGNRVMWKLTHREWDKVRVKAAA